jgi:hypothetical protein
MALVKLNTEALLSSFQRRLESIRFRWIFLVDPSLGWDDEP